MEAAHQPRPVYRKPAVSPWGTARGAKRPEWRFRRSPKTKAPARTAAPYRRSGPTLHSGVNARRETDLACNHLSGRYGFGIESY